MLSYVLPLYYIPNCVSMTCQTYGQCWEGSILNEQEFAWVNFSVTSPEADVGNIY